MIGILTQSDRIAQLQPLGDRIMIKVCGGDRLLWLWRWWKEGGRARREASDAGESMLIKADEPVTLTPLPTSHGNA